MAITNLATKVVIEVAIEVTTEVAVEHTLRPVEGSSHGIIYQESQQ